MLFRSAQLPIVCSDCGGGPEVIQGYGKLFPLGDATALAKILVSLLANPPVQTGSTSSALLTRFSDASARTGFLGILKTSGFDNARR